MNEVPLLYKVAAAVAALYGLVALIGGIIGYVKADSLASLIAGGVSGILLLLCAGGAIYWPFSSLVLAIVLSLALLGRFAPKVIGSISALGELTSTTAGVTALVMTLGGIAVVVAAGIALAARTGPPPT